MPFDYKHLRWSSWWDWKWQVLPVDKSQLIELVSPAARLGEISPEAAKPAAYPPARR